MKNLRAICLAVLSAAPVAAATLTAPEAVRIAYRPSEASTAYTVWTTETSRCEGPALKLPPLVVETASAVQQYQLAQADGDVEVVTERTARQGWINAKPAPVTATTAAAERFTMSPRGERRHADLTGTWSIGLEPVFPDQPIAPGHEWTAVVQATAKFPANVTVTHRFERIVTARGRRCAIIVSSARAKDMLPGKVGAFSVSYLGMLAIDLASGSALRARSSLTTAGKFSAPDQNGVTIVKKHVERWVERQ